MDDDIGTLKEFLAAHPELGRGLADYLRVSLSAPGKKEVSQLHTFCQELVEEIAVQTAASQELTPPHDGEPVRAFFDFLRARRFLNQEEFDYLLSGQLLLSGPAPDGIEAGSWTGFAVVGLLDQALMLAQKYTRWTAGQLQKFA